MASTPTDGVLRFDRFALDQRQRVLLRDGEIVRLTPKAFDLLELLVSRANEVVSKQELIDRVWPDTFVSEANLSKLVFMVRKELGEGPNGAYFETIPKRGYRFVGDLEGEGSAERPPAVIPRKRGGRRRARILIGAALTAVAVAVGSAALWWKERPRVSRPERTYVVVIPFEAATEGDELLARGISEFVAAKLSTIQGISVMPPVIPGLNADAKPRARARELGANLFLEGTVQRTGDRIGVACRLVSLDEKTQMGASSFIAASSDIFELEEQVAGKVASLLELNRSLRRSTDPVLATPERQQAYVRAIGLLSRYRQGSSTDDAILLLKPLAVSGARQSPLVMAELGRAYLLRFKLHGDRQDLDVAQSFAARATALEGGKARVHALNGAIARARGDLRGAVAELQAALALEPDAADVLIELASVYSATGLPQKAEATYEHVIRIHPVCAVCFNSYGLFYKKAGRLEDAIAMHRRAIALDPESSKFHSDLAVAFMFLGRFHDAVPVLKKALAISRDYEIINNLGYNEYLDGDYEAAARHFAEAGQRSPNDYLSWGNLGDALRCLPARRRDADDAFGRAIAFAREALQVNASVAQVHAHLGEYLAKHGEAAAADAEIAAALAAGPSAPDQADILFSAAAVATVHGRKPAAVDLLERAAAAGMSPTLFTADPQFTSLRSEPRFRAMGSSRAVR